TGISTLLLPSAVLAGIFGMNTKFGPFNGHPYDFWKIIIVMICATSILFVYFAKKHWLK
ncbi:MAG: hypothetical protein CO132_05095, partial [Candidatus Kerfeldbacteria bacterium CG_4_9_14_3_um_filter_45_8]